MSKYQLSEKSVMMMAELGIPDRMRGSIVRYTDNEIPPGDFLTAVINNDLKEAVGRADDQNMLLLPNYIRWFYNYAPSGCWGFPGAMEEWISR